MHVFHILFAMLPVLGFAAAVVVPEVGAQDAQDSPVVSDSAGDGAEAVGNESPDTPSSQPAGTSPEADAKPEPKVDGRALPPKVREVLDQLKTADPKAHGFLKDVLFRDRAYAKELPGGLQELKQLKETVAALPEGGLEAFKTEKAEWESIDAAYNGKDPKFLDIMVEANPESFNAFAPMVISKFAQTDPEGYQRHMAGVMVATLQNANVTGTLSFVSRLLAKGDTEGATQELKAIADWVAEIDKLAKTPPKTPDKAPENDSRQKELDDREFKLWVQETSTPINTFKSQAIRKELAQYIKGQQIDDETFEAIERQALTYLDGMLKADPKFMPTFEAYIENRDREGVTRYMRSRLEELLPSKNTKPGPVEKAYKLFFRGATPPKPGPKPAPGTKPPATPAPAGWVKVGKAPAPHEIDMKASPFEMRFKQAAVLKSGKKVFWGANAPA